MTIKISREVMLDILEDGAQVVEDTIVAHKRWAIVHQIVFSFEGKHYRTTYNRPATESQEESPWEYTPEVECVEVREVEKTVNVWEAA